MKMNPEKEMMVGGDVEKVGKHTQVEESINGIQI